MVPNDGDDDTNLVVPSKWMLKMCFLVCYPTSYTLYNYVCTYLQYLVLATCIIYSHNAIINDAV